MACLKSLRGMHDLLPNTALKHRFIAESARLISHRFGFQECATPIVEYMGVFDRTLGDTSDVVTKEMYSFADRSGATVALRPENTAGIARAFIEHGLQQSIPFKAFYHGPMFRYERPQKGRYRQFHQVGVELIGVAEAQADIEVITCADQFLKDLGLSQQVTLEINTLGDMESRAAYLEVLTAYFNKYKQDLSEDSLMRLNKNPLRILDSKDPNDRKIVVDAPLFADSLNTKSRTFFESVCEGLEILGLQFVHNPFIVRGLDYYSHTAFEFVTDGLGAQGTVLGGGRYDSLIESMGGPSTPGVGWSAGVERLAMLLSKEIEVTAPIALIPLDQEMHKNALKIALQLRSSGFSVDQAYSGTLTKRMKKADKMGSKFAIILGYSEWQRGMCIVKNLTLGEQKEIAIENIVSFFVQIL